MDAEEEAAWLREQEEEEDASDQSSEEVESAGEAEEGVAVLQLGGDRTAAIREVKFSSLISVFTLVLMCTCVGYCSQLTDCLLFVEYSTTKCS